MTSHARIRIDSSERPLVVSTIAVDSFPSIVHVADRLDNWIRGLCRTGTKKLV